MSDDLINPRTKQERMAYVTGYANAINDTADHDLAHARKWLLEMIETENPEMAEKIRSKT